MKDNRLTPVLDGPKSADVLPLDRGNNINKICYICPSFHLTNYYFLIEFL